MGTSEPKQHARARVAKQPPPKPAQGDVWLEVLTALPPDLDDLRPLCEARRQQRIETHGAPLQRDNGRDHPTDAIGALLDAAAHAWAGNLPELALECLRLAQRLEREALSYDVPW